MEVVHYSCLHIYLCRVEDICKVMLLRSLLQNGLYKPVQDTDKEVLRCSLLQMYLYKAEENIHKEVPLGNYLLKYHDRVVEGMYMEVVHYNCLRIYLYRVVDIHKVTLLRSLLLNDLYKLAQDTDMVMLRCS